MVRKEKAEAVKELEEVFKSASTLVMAEYRGLTVSQQTQLRKDLKKAGASFNVVKMSLAKRAAENVGYKDILEYFAGPTGIAVIESDPVEAAKVLKKFSTENEAFVVKGGLMEEDPLTIEQLNVLASIDSRDVLLAKIAGRFNAPVSKLARTLKGVLNKPGYAFKALLENKESTGEINSESEESEASDEAKEEIKKEEE